MDDISGKLNALFTGGLVRFTLSSPSGNTYKKAVFRPGGKGFFLELFTDTKAFHENLSAEAAADRAAGLFISQFKNADGETPQGFVYMRRSKSGRLLLSEKKKSAPTATPAVPREHNRKKNYIIDENEPLPVLYELGIFTADGKIAAQMYDKFKQINRYIEFIDDIVSNDSRETWNIIDFGCGKSYLTFILYHYLVNIKNKKAEITGLDLKEEVIERCSALSEKFGYNGLSFRLGSIENFQPERKPDMVISLHACDIATDYAIFNAVRWEAPYILAVPCCQHELNAALSPDALPVVTRYGLLRERFSAIATDALRARLLEYCGYRVDVTEFIELSHSPKNILLRAKKIDAPPPDRSVEIKKDIDALVGIIGKNQTLHRLIMLNFSLDNGEKR